MGRARLGRAGPSSNIQKDIETHRTSSDLEPGHTTTALPPGRLERACRSEGRWEMSSRLWRWYADRQFHKWEKTVLWDMVEPYRPPRSFKPLVGTYVAAFYTAVVAAALTEQLYKVRTHPPPDRFHATPPSKRLLVRGSAHRSDGARRNAQRYLLQLLSAGVAGTLNNSAL